MKEFIKNKKIKWFIIFFVVIFVFVHMCVNFRIPRLIMLFSKSTDLTNICQYVDIYDKDGKLIADRIYFNSDYDRGYYTCSKKYAGKILRETIYVRNRQTRIQEFKWYINDYSECEQERHVLMVNNVMPKNMGDIKEALGDNYFKFRHLEKVYYAYIDKENDVFFMWGCDASEYKNKKDNAKIENCICKYCESKWELLFDE